MNPRSQLGHYSFRNLRLCKSLLSVALAAQLAPLTAATGEVPEAQLPADGAWARYAEEWQRLDNGAKTSHKITLSFVGRVMEQDEPCQWIEIKTVVPAGDSDEGTYVHKYLVRQSALLKGNNPLEEVVRVWSKDKDNAPDVPPNTQRHDIGFGSLLLWTPGVLKDAGRSDQAKDIDYQKGRLKSCHARTGRLSLPVRDKNGNVEFTWSRSFTAWQHPDLPIGFSGAEVRDEILSSDLNVRSAQSTVYTLEDAGTGAKSELPDNN